MAKCLIGHIFFQSHVRYFDGCKGEALDFGDFYDDGKTDGFRETTFGYFGGIVWKDILMSG